MNATITGGEKSNTQVAGYDVQKVKDIGTIATSFNSIGSEISKTSKQVLRDGADVMENTGDGLVIAAPATGPFAPAVAGAGEVISTIGTSTNILMDVGEGNYKSAGTRVINEVVTGGLSTVAKNAPGVDEATSRIIDAHIGVYDNAIIPAVKEKRENKKLENQD